MKLRIDMPDGSSWMVPVEVIALNRAKHFAHEYDGDVMASLKDDTAPLFESDTFEIEDWAANNMDWEEVEPYAFEWLRPSEPADYQEGWVNGHKEIEGDRVVDIALARRQLEAEKKRA